MFINDYTELKALIFRKLGSESFTIEISDDNFTDIYNINLKYLQEHTEDAVNKKYVITDFNSEKDIQLADNVLAVTHIFLNQDNINLDSYYYPSIAPTYNFLVGKTH